MRNMELLILNHLPFGELIAEPNVIIISSKSLHVFLVLDMVTNIGVWYFLLTHIIITLRAILTRFLKRLAKLTPENFPFILRG